MGILLLNGWTSTAAYWIANITATISVLVVGGGGGGGSDSGKGGGGGGGGGIVYIEQYNIIKDTQYQIVVGKGGVVNTNGDNSVFDTITAYGGGRGSSSTSANLNGGCGGGGANGLNGGTSSQGYNGGTSTSSNFGAGGGGGGEVEGQIQQLMFVGMEELVIIAQYLKEQSIMQEVVVEERIFKAHIPKGLVV